MGLLLLFLFLPSLAVWVGCTYVTVGSWPLSSTEWTLGLVLTVLALVGPLVKWKRAGRMYALAPPFFYLGVCVLLPAGVALLANVLPLPSALLVLVHGLTLAVTLVFPIVCGYFFLAPARWSVPRLLGIPTDY